MLEGGVGGEDRVVRLDDRAGVLLGGVDTELELALLAVVEGQALHEEGAEARAGTTTKGVEDKEALETRAVVGDAANLIENGLDELLSDGVVTTGVVVGGILLAGDHQLGVEEVLVGAGADLINNVGLEITVDGAGDVLALACMEAVSIVVGLWGRDITVISRLVALTSLGEEGAEALVLAGGLALLGEVAIRLFYRLLACLFLRDHVVERRLFWGGVVYLDTVLEAVELWWAASQ